MGTLAVLYKGFQLILISFFLHKFYLLHHIENTCCFTFPSALPLVSLYTWFCSDSSVCWQTLFLIWFTGIVFSKLTVSKLKMKRKMVNWYKHHNILFRWDTHLYMSVFPSVHPSICPSVHSSVRPSINPSFHPSVHLSVHPSIRPSCSMSQELYIIWWAIP